MAVEELNTKELNDLRNNKAKAENEVFLSKEKRNRLIEDLSKLKRHLDPGNSGQMKEYKALEAQINAEEQKIKSISERMDNNKGRLDRAWGDFMGFTDLKENIKKLDDRYPILLMPLRIETRFKKIKTDNNQIRDELWVRAYPDDCFVDTFEENLSVSEIKDAEIFWTDFWAAAGDEPKRRAAWRYLADGHGYGRAQYLINKLTPDNYEEILSSGEEPGKPAMYLVINGKSEITEGEKTHLSGFWYDYYLAKTQNDKEGMDTAVTALTGNLGAERSAFIVQNYPPKNINNVPPTDDPDKLILKVKFISFENDPDYQQSTWSHSPKVSIMPERLYLLAYTGEERVIEVPGNLIPFPLIVGPDPKISEDQMYSIPGTDIRITKDMQWMVDFEEAVNKGMGFRVELTPEQAINGFDKLFVLGIKLSSTRAEGKADFEELIKHHYSGNSGFSFLPVGTPTNNTLETKSGYNTSEDADDSYDLIFKNTGGDNENNNGDSDAAFWWDKTDREWFCELLGISEETFNNTINTNGSDQREARAMNVALWPATWGYYFETMLEGVLSDEQIKNIRWYFNNFVIGRGNIPSIRIDDQPYGILPTTAFSRIRWINKKTFITPADIANEIPPGFKEFLPLLNSKFSIFQSDWKRMSEKVCHVGSGGDPHQALLDILGLHGGSVEFYNRIGESYEHIYNLFLVAQSKKSQLNFKLNKTAVTDISFAEALQNVLNAIGNANGGRLLLNELGYKGDDPEILKKLFVLAAEKLEGPLIDDQPLSESSTIREYSKGADGNTPENYLQWIMRVAATSFEALRREEGFNDNLRPNALLYLMLKYALEQSYFISTLNLYLDKNLISPERINVAKAEPGFVHVRVQDTVVNRRGDISASESKYNLLYQKQPAITGSPDKLVHEFIPEALKERHIATQYLYEQIEAIKLLAESSTARLERLLTEHLDCASYRFDAWKSGIVNYQLKALRNQSGEQTEKINTGLYIGAYGWLENVHSENKELTPKELPENLKAIFNPSDQYPIQEDSSNLGYVNAPSLNHAVTAAILRNGYEAYSDEQNADIFNVNLSSERVRKALKMIEGIQNGQSLAALLGYEFERGLHDNNKLASVDQYIYKIRRKFPLGSNQIKSTYENDENVSVDKIEANNVVHGLDLIEFADARLGPADEPLYFDDLGLGPVSGQVKDIIVSEVDNIRNINDAVADLAFAESVHQIAQGNIDRAAGTLDAYSTGNYPQIPEVIQTPRSGVNLTHRVGIHIKANAAITKGQSPRAMAEPGLNLFLEDILPDLSKICAYASFYHLPSDTEITDNRVSMTDLNLQPVDLLFLVNSDTDKAMTALDDLIVNHILDSAFEMPAGPDQPLRPDANIRIRYFKVTADGFVSVFEIAPLIGHLKSILLKSRTLSATDLISSSKAAKEVNVKQSLDKARIEAVMEYLEDVPDVTLYPVVHSLLNGKSPKKYLDDLVADLTESLKEGGDDDAAIIGGIDERIDACKSILRVLSAAGMPQTGTGFLNLWRQTQLLSIYKKVNDLIKIWDDKEDEFNALMGDYDPAAADAMDLLIKAERIISASATPDPGDDPEVFRTGIMAAKLTAFRQKRDNEFKNFVNTNHQEVSAALTALKPVISFEGLYSYEDPYHAQTDKTHVQIDPTDIEKSCRPFANEILTKLKLVKADLLKKLDKINNVLFPAFDTETDPGNKVKLLQEAGKTLMGEDFKMIPSFSMPADLALEFSNALGRVDDLLDFQENVRENPLPVDNWFYGVARVREQMGKMEQAIMVIEGLTGNEIELTPVQFPMLEPYCWFACEFGHPDEDTNKNLHRLFRENDHLLYTAYYHEPFIPGNDVCGLFIDEWTEIVPTEEETAGTTFHFDRPNSEPSQTMLLAVSPQLSGEGWDWEDLVSVLNDTLAEAKLRAVEPQQIEQNKTSESGSSDVRNTGYANLLPATVSAATKYPVSIMLNYAFNNLPLTSNIIADD